MCFVFSKDSCIDLGKPQLQETPPTMVVRKPTAAEIPSLTLRLLMSYIYIYIYIYGAPILDVSRSHTTTQHSR